MTRIRFSDLVEVKGGNLFVADDNLEKVHTLMKQATEKYPDARERSRIVGQGLMEPIRQLAPYKSWTDMFFMDVPLTLRDDNRVPLDDPIAVAFETHPEGAVALVRPRLKWARPSYDAIDTGVELPWDVMAAANWAVLRRKLTEAAEELARLKDAIAQQVLDVAVCSLTGHTYGVATAISKTTVDTVFKDAATIGFPITQVAINTGTMLAMRTWSGNSFGLQALPDDEVRALLYTGYIGEYGGARWYAHHSVPTNQVYFSGDPNQIGYHQRFGGTEVNSDVDIQERVDIHTMHEKHAWYVANAYALWRLTVT